MEIVLDITKSLEDNAAIYFEKAKKAKKKLKGAIEALEMHEKSLKKAIKNKEMKKKKVERKKFWFEKFRWFFSSEGFLVIGGRDATTNEIIIKKHTDKEDMVFHTDMAGSPFFVVKKKENIFGNDKIGETTLKETAQATASFSKAWKMGMTTLDTFYVSPDQVTKKAQSGEYLSKGSFMIRGKTNYLKPNIELAIGMVEYENTLLPMCAPKPALEKYTKDIKILRQGRTKPSEIAKKLAKYYSYNDIDEFIRILPSGNIDMR